MPGCRCTSAMPRPRRTAPTRRCTSRTRSARRGPHEAAKKQRSLGMQYTIEADEEFLRVSVSGRETDQPPSDVCAAVLAESRKHGRERILIELDQKFPLS